jgi:hypothetical protein
MPKRQQPVPPLYSPESIADAILWAADHAPREMAVGMPTAMAITGQKVVAGPLDAHLARAAWEPQLIDEPNDQKADILFDTLPGDPGAHGPYLDRERGADLQMRVRMHLVPAVLGAAGALAAAATLVLSATARADRSPRWAGSRTRAAAGRS